MKITTSKLKINKQISTPINNIYSDDVYYTDEKISKTEPLSFEYIQKLCNNIDSLNKDEHIQLYILMRENGVSADFFSTTNRGVYFDFLKLSCDLQWKIYNMIKMTIENIDRSKLIKTYSVEYENQIKKLDHDLSVELDKMRSSL